MINKKEDLHNTYIVNDHGELRSLYLKVCFKFGLHKYVDGDDRFLDDFYNTAIIQCDEYSLPNSEGILQRGVDIDESFTEITMSDLTQQTKEVEWVNGEPLEFMGEPCVFIGMSEGLPVVRYTSDADKALSGTIDVITAVDMLSKPETEAERIEREELKAAYQLQSKCAFTASMSFESFKDDSNVVKFWLKIVRETEYRKESE